MKSDRKTVHFKRGRGLLGALSLKESLKENALSNFQGRENEEPNQSGHAPRPNNKMRPQRVRKLVSSKLSKSLTEKTNHFNNSTPGNKMTSSKLPKLNTRKSIQPKNTENIENKPNTPIIKSLIASCFDETSNHSVGSNSYSTASSNTTESSDGMNIYSLNLTSTEITSKYFELKSSSTIVTLNEETEPVEKKPAENVLVPSFREKKFKWYYNIEATENVSDDIYLKRHQKHENDEIKMQRWDRMRQKNELERQRLLFKENKHQNQVVEVKQSTSGNNCLDPENDMYIIQIIGNELGTITESTTTQPLEATKRTKRIRSQLNKSTNEEEDLNGSIGGEVSKRRRLLC